MKAAHPMSFAALLEHGGNDHDSRAELMRQTRRLLMPVAIVAALLAVWSAAAPLSGAVPKILRRTDTGSGRLSAAAGAPGVRRRRLLAMP